ncbi:Type II pantothenate kinase [Cordyceps fumosorosea ARSEF 2679]|uniref:Type II pantothenate kinase n=1 Tax=Cordyceps fumosorosea (strain ARSEF 2679) TaxID=1081104 RepID=A0A168D5Q9_CORFA|nr:Type II pantothenate kinase [Cordyceps fumosorosea ARSEF 2679]OAA72203.1 Type II pantothenate kinase [Cordyceps fumosorosea ARSEF 2679]
MSPFPPLQIPPADHPSGREEQGETTTATTTARDPSSLDAAAPTSLRPTISRSRTMTTTAEIDSTIAKPGSVKINVTGAFIVDPDTATPKNGRVSPTTHHETSDIRLPNHTAVVSHIAVDIGGSLIKLVYFSREVDQTDPGGRLTFQTFETDRIDDCVEFMRELRDRQAKLTGSRPGDLAVMATGGGAYKFYDKIRDALGVDVSREDEMECLIIGLDFFITEIPREVFTYSETDPMHFVGPRDAIYPYLLVNIGSGVSMLKVTGPRAFERVGGTSLGGGTLWGLLSLLTGARTFDEMLEQAGNGDNTHVDMLVGDIYGQDYGKIGLKSTTIASSFGRVFKMKKDAEAAAAADGHDPNGTTPRALPRGPGFTDGDIARSLLYAVSNNIGQIALLQSQIHNLSDIYFGGSFIRGHRQTINTLSYAIKFWSKGAKQAYFLRHEGYLGAVGAFLKRQPKNWGRRGSLENIAALDELQEWRKQRAKDEAAAAS